MRILCVVVFSWIMASNVVLAQYKSDVTVPDSSTLLTDVSIPSIQFAQTITTEDMKSHLTILASDEFEGRETGESGNEKAAQYIAKHFGAQGFPKIGLEQSYFQNVSFTWTSWRTAEIFVNEQRFKHLWDFISYPESNELSEIETDEVIFLGYGIDDPKYSDYKRSKKLKGKTIMIYNGEPRNQEGISFITGSAESSEWSNSTDLKLKAANAHGVKEVLIIVDNIQALLAANRGKLLGPSVKIGDLTQSNETTVNSSYISTNIAVEIIGEKAKKVFKARDRMNATGKSRSVCLPTSLKINKDLRSSQLDGKNVMGYIEGSDKKDELVVVSAHYDHLGKRGEAVYNGADDNGSGTTAVLEISEAFKLAKEAGHGPRRSILFLLVTGEEKGLLGSEYYAMYPQFPLENTVCNVNIDMVGRVDEKYQENHNYIYVIGSDRLSTDLHEINETVNNQFSNLVLDYTYNDEKDPNRYYYRSDHYNFAKNGVPAIFFFSGTHKDYHRTSDTVEKINFEKMERVSRHIYHTIWEISNREDRIEVNGEEGS